MPATLRQRIVKQLKPENSRIDELTQLDAALGLWFVDAVENLMNHAGVTTDDVDIIGSHGQTMWHDVQQPRDAHSERMTWQLGDGSFIAAKTGITTVCDFRTADVALGGQGAPLMPVFDALMYGNQRASTIALQNIGGIGNVTLLPQAASAEDNRNIMGFDTGPGNMVIDRFAEIISHGRLLYDKDGLFSSQGKVDEALLQSWLEHSFYQQSPPKSTGREQFGHEYADTCWQDCVARGVSPFDAIATATALTARTIAHSYEQAALVMGVYPEYVVVSGGGAHNPTLMRLLAADVRPGTRVSRAGEACDINGLPLPLSDAALTLGSVIEADSKEAVAFAVFAYQAVCGRSNHLPATTGASHEIILGKLCPGMNFRQLVVQPQPRHYLHHHNHRGRGETTAASSLSLPLSLPVTETRNSASMALDSMVAEEVVQLINDEDRHVAQVVASLRSTIATVATEMAKRIVQGGRVFYVGAGTSGRLGVLDASEIPPTFSAPSAWFQGLIAGGDQALRNAVEGAEDNREQGKLDLLAKELTDLDVVVGIAASGTTPYVHGALQAAKEACPGSHTVLIACNPLLETDYPYIDTFLTAVVGPEILTGSTRMKAGTATKLILNQLSTVAMIVSGKTYGNLMVDLRVSNQKLRRRAIRILKLVLGDMDDDDAVQLLEQAGNQVKVAIAMRLTGVTTTKEEAEAVLRSHHGRLGHIVARSAAGETAT
jgi:N-acetylmuramic acid 6-phosphate etherase